MLKILNLPTAAQFQLQSATRPIPYDSVVEIARVTDDATRADLISKVLSGANVRDIRQHVKIAKRHIPATEKKVALTKTVRTSRKDR